MPAGGHQGNRRRHQIANTQRTVDYRYVDKSIAVEDLPSMVDGQTTWSPNESFSYIAFYLAKVKAILDGKPEGMIISTQLLGQSARLVEVKLESPDASQYGHLWEELSDRLQMFK